MIEVLQKFHDRIGNEDIFNSFLTIFKNIYFSIENNEFYASIFDFKFDSKSRKVVSTNQSLYQDFVKDKNKIIKMNIAFAMFEKLYNEINSQNKRDDKLEHYDELIWFDVSAKEKFFERIITEKIEDDFIIKKFLNYIEKKNFALLNKIHSDNISKIVANISDSFLQKYILLYF